MIVFQLFSQNEKAFRDQDLVIEAQQSARAVASQIADEIRMAGQGMPLFSASFDETESESAAVILNGSDDTRINFRAGLSLAESDVRSPVPVDFTLGQSRSVTVGNASIFSNVLGSSSPVSRFVYIWGPAANDDWAWVRAELTAIVNSADLLSITPLTAGDIGRSTGRDSMLRTFDDGITFLRPPSISLEEAVTFYLSAGSVRRAIAANMAMPENLSWSSPNEIGRNFTSLTFAYYDGHDRVVSPNTLSRRRSVARVDVRVTSQTALPLSNGSRPTYGLAVRTLLRNTLIR